MGDHSGRRPKYRIPGTEKVERAIMDLMNEAMTVRSQRLFHRLVLSKIKNTEETKYRLSPTRLRRIAAQMCSIDLIIHCRDSDKKLRRTRCPVCGQKMRDVKNSTLYGWTVSTGKICDICGYWSGYKERIPIRYVFTIEKEAYLGEKIRGREVE